MNRLACCSFGCWLGLMPACADLTASAGGSEDEDGSSPGSTGDDAADPADPEPGELEPWRWPDGGSGPPPPVSGGTLLVTRDQRWVVVADPDRDLIHLFDVAARVEAFTIEVPHRSEPGRIAQDDEGRVWVALRRSGEVVELDPDDGAIIQTHVACRNPRGMAHDRASGDLLVVCAERVLARIHPVGEVTRSSTQDELRDIVSTSPLLVSNYRRPSVGLLGIDGNSELPVAVPQLPLTSGGEATPVVAVRTLATERGWVMLHRLVTSEPLQVSTGGYYGPGPCGIPSATGITVYDGSAPPKTRTISVTHVVDIAQNDDGTEITVVGRDAQGRGRYARLLDGWDEGGCSLAVQANTGGDPIGVAYDGADNLWVHSREPSELYRIGPGGDWTRFPLTGDSVYDLGHDLFHRPTSGGVACATCHPEGRDDGYTFAFASMGSRRTQALNVNLRGTDPLHWAGDLANMTALIEEVRVNRMLGVPLTHSEKRALASYVFDLPRDRPRRESDEAAVVRGAETFEEAGCTECHFGPKLTNNQTMALGGGKLQVPPLLGVAFRPPYMHDGRCPDLHCSVLAMLPYSDGRDDLDDNELADLVAYLESL